jgi:hypothetical protein
VLLLLPLAACVTRPPKAGNCDPGRKTSLVALLALELLLLLRLTTPSCGIISRVCPSDHLKRYAASPSLVPA